jgi:hypothetical protein
MLVRDKGKTAYKLQGTIDDRLKAKEIGTKEVRERQREGRMDPAPSRSSPSVLFTLSGFQLVY